MQRPVQAHVAAKAVNVAGAAGNAGDGKDIPIGFHQRQAADGVVAIVRHIKVAINAGGDAGG